jgi:hypothetical protein
MQQAEERYLSTNKKQTINANERQAYIDKWRESGLSMSIFCRQHHLALSSFSGWVKKSKTNIAEKLFKSVVPVSSAVPQSGIGIVEIIFQNSIKIRFLNLPDVSLILKVTKELAACN